MGRGLRSKRRQPTRTIGRKLIIVCEGKRTEYGYFESIRMSMRLPTLQVHVVHPDGTDPLTIVRAAIRYRQDRTLERAWTGDDSAWAVFDGDEHRDHNPHNWNDAIQLAGSKNIHLAVSNPSFELWYLLHYHDQRAQLTRVDALVLLRQYLQDYRKAMVLWPALKALTPEAIARAKRLAERAVLDGAEAYRNPSTSVCELVESLLTLEHEVNRML